MMGRDYSFEALRARTFYRRQNLKRIITSDGLAISPRAAAPGGLFVTEPVGCTEMAGVIAMSVTALFGCEYCP